MTLPETGSMRTTCGSPFGPVVDADPDLLAVARHRAVQRHRRPTLFVAASIRTTRPMFWTPTQTPPGPAVMICGPVGAGRTDRDRRDNLLVAGSMRVTDPLCSLATHTEPCGHGDARGCRPTGIRATTLR